MPKKATFIVIGIGSIFFFLSFFMTRFAINRFANAQTASQSAQLLLASATNEVAVGDLFTVGIGLDSQTDTVIGVDTLLHFNSDLVDVVGVALGSSELQTLVPGDNNQVDLTRAVHIDAVNPANSTLEIGLVAFDLVSQATTSGVLGTFDPLTNPLATIAFRAKQQSGVADFSYAFTALGDPHDSNVVALFDTPEDILLTPTDTVGIAIVAPTPTPAPIGCIQIDYNTSGEIDVQDIMQIASRWGLSTGDPNYDPIYDLDNNGNIDVVDIQLVAARFGEPCVIGG